MAIGGMAVTVARGTDWPQRSFLASEVSNSTVLTRIAIITFGASKMQT